MLRATAEYRIGGVLRAHVDPEDLVQEVWAAALPRLGDLAPREGRYTPSLLKFLGSILLHRIGNLARKHIRERKLASRGPDTQGGEADPLAAVEARSTGVQERLERREAQDQVSASLARLDPRDREILLLRGVEGHAYKEIAVILGADAKSLAVRYQRALEKLRRELPGSIYDELDGA